MKKLLTSLLLSGLCFSAVPANAWHSCDGWAPFAVGSVVGLGLGAAAASTHSDHCHRQCHTIVIDDRNDLRDQNDLLRAKVNSLKEAYADLREENNELREENEALRRKIRKLKHSDETELTIKVDKN